jgi:hypothetical protein
MKLLHVHILAHSGRHVGRELMIVNLSYSREIKSI